MTLEGWRDHSFIQARNIVAGEEKALNLLSRFLKEADDATELLRDKGYGWTGLGLLETVALIPPAERHN